MSTSEERVAVVLRRAKLETASRDVIAFGVGPLWVALLSIVTAFFKLGSDRFYLKGNSVSDSADAPSDKRENQNG